MAVYLTAFCFFYLTALFPFAYFRHDDWLIALNGISLEGNWNNLFNSKLTHGNVERVWFFRPLFKFNGFLFWKLFGENYFVWLLGTLLFTVGALALAWDSLRIFPTTAKKAPTFLALFVCAPLIHFGSLTWAGEGLMNCPQLFFLALSTWGFLKALACKQGVIPSKEQAKFTALSLLAWFISFGFKESSVFHLPFFFALLVDRKIGRLTWAAAFKSIIPHAALAAFYLLGRGLLVPMNSDYLMRLSVTHVGLALIYFIGILGTPAFLIYVFGALDRELKKISYFTAVTDDIAYLAFFAISIAPYVAQPFFSVGWPLLPGFFFVYFLAMRTSPLLPTKRNRVALALFVLQATAAGAYLNYLGWWNWKAPQQFLMAVVDEAVELPVSKIRVANCSKPPYQHLAFERVVVHDSGLISMWHLKGGKSVEIDYLNCDGTGSPIGDNELVFYWEYPKLELIKIPSRAQAPLKALLTQRPALPLRPPESLSPRPLNGSRFPSSSPPSP